MYENDALGNPIRRPPPLVLSTKQGGSYLSPTGAASLADARALAFLVFLFLVSWVLSCFVFSLVFF
jgi:hypothetical protein